MVACRRREADQLQQLRGMRASHHVIAALAADDQAVGACIGVVDGVKQNRAPPVL